MVAVVAARAPMVRAGVPAMLAAGAPTLAAGVPASVVALVPDLSAAEVAGGFRGCGCGGCGVGIWFDDDIWFDGWRGRCCASWGACRLS